MDAAILLWSILLTSRVRRTRGLLNRSGWTPGQTVPFPQLAWKLDLSLDRPLPLDPAPGFSRMCYRSRTTMSTRMVASYIPGGSYSGFYCTSLIAPKEPRMDRQYAPLATSNLTLEVLRDPTSDFHPAYSSGTRQLSAGTDTERRLTS